MSLTDTVELESIENIQEVEVMQVLSITIEFLCRSGILVTLERRDNDSSTSREISSSIQLSISINCGHSSLKTLILPLNQPKMEKLLSSMSQKLAISKYLEKENSQASLLLLEQENFQSMLRKESSLLVVCVNSLHNRFNKMDLLCH